MKKGIYLFLVVFLLGAFLLTACGGGGGNTEGGTEGSESGEEAEATVPAEYAGKTNPVAGDATAASAGQTIYAQNCASCHGDNGKGDGPSAASLDPKPSDLTQEVKNNSEDFLFWRISEGGGMAPFNSAMPAWKGVLTEQQIWQVVTHIETWK